jgi:hypothetical protein
MIPQCRVLLWVVCLSGFMGDTSVQRLLGVVCLSGFMGDTSAQDFNMGRLSEWLHG